MPPDADDLFRIFWSWSVEFFVAVGKRRRLTTPREAFRRAMELNIIVVYIKKLCGFLAAMMQVGR